MSVATALGLEQSSVHEEEKYDPTQPALRLEINVQYLPKNHPVVHWPSLVIVNEKEALLASGNKDPELWALLEQREKIYNNEAEDSEEERRRLNMSYDSDDSFIDDDVQHGDMNVRTKVGGFFVATGDSIGVEKIEEEPEKEEPAKEKKKGKRKRDSDDDISSEVNGYLKQLKKKIEADSACTKESLAKAAVDTTVKDPLHRKLLPFLLKMDLKLFNDKAGLRNRVWEEVCKLIPYAVRNHRQLTELVERFCETVVDEEPSEDKDLWKLRVDWYLKTITKRRNEQRKKTTRKIKKAVEKAKNSKEKIDNKNRPGFADLKQDIYPVGTVCNKYAKLRRLSGHKNETNQSAREELFQKFTEVFPKECKVDLKAVKQLWEQERKRAEGGKKKSDRKRSLDGASSPKKKKPKRKGPLRGETFHELPSKDPWNDKHFIET